MRLLPHCWPDREHIGAWPVTALAPRSGRAARSVPSAPDSPGGTPYIGRSTRSDVCNLHCIVGTAHHHGSVSTTPLWVPLVVAGLGVAGTLTAGIAGGLITQRWANKREDRAWARERERERERWAREDEARTFEHRREVFEDFYEAVRALARRAYDHGYGFDGTPELPFDWNADAGAKLNRLGLYADRRLAAAAAAAYNAAFWWGQHTKYDDPDDPEFYERQQRFDDAEYELLVLLRQALSIPEGDLSLPVPGYSNMPGETAASEDKPLWRCRPGRSALPQSSRFAECSAKRSQVRRFRTLSFR